MKNWKIYVSCMGLFMVLGFFTGTHLFSSPDLVVTDVNQNGIWDDVEQGLSIKFKGYPTMQPASLEMGKLLQKFLENPSTKTIVEQDREFSWSLSCFVASGMRDGLTIDEALDQVDVVRDTVVSNSVRQKRWIEVQKSLSGHFLSFDAPSMGRCPKYIREM